MGKKKCRQVTTHISHILGVKYLQAFSGGKKQRNAPNPALDSVAKWMVEDCIVRLKGAKNC